MAGMYHRRNTRQAEMYLLTPEVTAPLPESVAPIVVCG